MAESAFREFERAKQPDVIKVGDALYYPRTGLLTGPRGETHVPSGKQHDLLKLFVEMKSEVVTNELFNKRLYPAGDAPEKGMLKVLSCHLRRKFEAVSDSIEIDVVRGKGYQLVVKQS